MLFRSLELGELFTQGKLDRAKSGLLQLLKSNGYHQAAVEAQPQPGAGPQQMDIHFQIRPGARAHIQEVKFEGDPGFPEAKLEVQSRLKAGKPATAQRVQDALQRLRKFYQDKERLAAHVDLVERHYLPEKNAEQIVIRATAGPRVAVRIHGERISGRSEERRVGKECRL